MCSTTNTTTYENLKLFENKDKFLDESQDANQIDIGVFVSCVILSVVSLVSGLAIACGVLLGDGGFRRTHFSKFNSARILQCSHVASGLILTVIFTPSLLSALIQNYQRQDAPDWVCNMGWMSGVWGWSVQLIATGLINYERLCAVKSPISGQVSTSTSFILAGISWFCGGAIAVTVSGGFPESPLTIVCACEFEQLYLDPVLYVLLPIGSFVHAAIVGMWFVIARTSKRRSRVMASGDLKRDSITGTCIRPKCPCHSEIELVTIAKSSSPFCPTCATKGWWSSTQRPETKTQAGLSSVGQWTVPLVMGMSQLSQVSTVSQLAPVEHKPQSSNSKEKLRPPPLKQKGDQEHHHHHHHHHHHLSITTTYSGEMSTSPCPSPGPMSKKPDDGEDTFTLGGIYIGSLESHMRTHQAFCSGMNVRSQGSQTGEEEISPPVIEWRLNTSKENLDEMAKISPVADSSVQCTLTDLEKPTHQPLANQSTSYMLKVAGEVCVRDARARLAGRTHLEFARTVPAFLLTLCQLVLWLPLAITAIVLGASHGKQSMDGWKTTLLTLCIGNLSPSLAPLLYFVAARCSRAF